MRVAFTAAGIGIVAGLTGGMFGVGGGLVAVPALVLLLNVAQHRAHATSLAAIVVTATAAAIPFATEGSVDWRVSAMLFAGAAVGAWIGAGLMGRLDQVWLARAFVVLTFVAGVRMLFAGDAAATEILEPSGFAGGIGLVVTGLVAGIVAALLGVGGGVVYVPALVVLFGLGQHLAQGTSLAAIVPTTLVAAVRHARHRRVDWRLASLVAAGGIAGGLLGAFLALDLAPTLLRQLFVAFLLLVTVRMALKAGRPVREPVSPSAETGATGPDR